MITKRRLMTPSERFPVKRSESAYSADIRVRITKKMRDYLEKCVAAYGYSSMSKFCRDLLIIELDCFVDERGLE